MPINVKTKTNAKFIVFMVTIIITKPEKSLIVGCEFLFIVVE